MIASPKTPNAKNSDPGLLIVVTGIMGPKTLFYFFKAPMFLYSLSPALIAVSLEFRLSGFGAYARPWPFLWLWLGLAAAAAEEAEVLQLLQHRTALRLGFIKGP